VRAPLIRFYLSADTKSIV